MRNVTLLCVGKLKEACWRDACAEYAKRLSAFCKFKIQELPEYKLPYEPSAAEIETALKEEGKRLLEAAGNTSLVALCIEGKMFPSEELASWMQELALRGESSVTFVIGSSFGLCEEVKQKAVLRLSLSPMTFPHQLARVMLCEQIYRTFQILSNGKYHK